MTTIMQEIIGLATMAIALGIADTLIEMIMPDGNMAKYVRFVWAVLTILIVAARFLSIAGIPIDVFAFQNESTQVSTAAGDGGNFYQQKLLDFLRSFMEDSSGN